MKATTPSLPFLVPLAIPANWTPEQARAVVEVLDELRNLIWAHYGLQVLDEFHNHNRSSNPPF